MYGEARDYLRAQVATIEGIDDKTTKVIRLNALVVSFLVAGISFFFRQDLVPPSVPPWLLVLFLSGFLFLLSSTVMAIATYLKKGISVGLDANYLVEALRRRLVERTFYVQAIRTYSMGINSNTLLIERTSRRLEITLTFLLIGMVIVSTGAISILGLARD